MRDVGEQFASYALGDRRVMTSEPFLEHVSILTWLKKLNANYAEPNANERRSHELSEFTVIPVTAFNALMD